MIREGSASLRGAALAAPERLECVALFFLWLGMPGLTLVPLHGFIRTPALPRRRAPPPRPATPWTCVVGPSFLSPFGPVSACPCSRLVGTRPGDQTRPGQAARGTWCAGMAAPCSAAQHSRPGLRLPKQTQCCQLTCLRPQEVSYAWTTSLPVGGRVQCFHLEIITSQSFQTPK